MLPIHKNYIDSRFKSSDSASHSDFKIDLPITFLLPDDTEFYIEDVCIPHTWYPISERNNIVAFKYNNTSRCYAYVTPGNYNAVARCCYCCCYECYSSCYFEYIYASL